MMNKTITFKTDILPYSDEDYSIGNESLRWKVNGYVISEAAKKQVDESIESPSSNLPTTAAVMEYIDQKFKEMESALTHQLEEKLNNIKSMLTSIENNVASRTYNTGDAFIYDDHLYKATEIIFIGDAIIPNVNCTQTSIIKLLM